MRRRKDSGRRSMKQGSLKAPLLHAPSATVSSMCCSSCRSFRAAVRIRRYVEEDFLFDTVGFASPLLSLERRSRHEFHKTAQAFGTFESRRLFVLHVELVAAGNTPERPHTARHLPASQNHLSAKIIAFPGGKEKPPFLDALRSACDQRKSRPRSRARRSEGSMFTTRIALISRMEMPSPSNSRPPTALTSLMRGSERVDWSAPAKSVSAP